MQRRVPASQALAGLTFEDLRVGGLTVFGEARGEILLGQQGVSWSVINRACIDLWGDKRPDWWGEGIQAICLKSGQYEAWNGAERNRANRAAMEAATFADPVYVRCHAVFGLVVAAALGTPFGSDFGSDPTYGSTHYYRIGTPEPPWARGKTPVVALGRHAFFNNVEPGAPNA